VKNYFEESSDEEGMEDVQPHNAK